MRETDLELHRWKWHNLQLKSRKKNHLFNMSCCAFWRELGAFISVMPRQSGKSTMLMRMVSILSDVSEDQSNFLFVVPTANQKRLADALFYPYTVHTAFDHNILIRRNFKNCHLMVDEFAHIKRADLDKWLDYNWRSVTMVSSI